MSGELLLDTNAIIALFAGDNAVQALLTEATDTFVPSIALGELYYGAHKSNRCTENLGRLDEFAAASAVLRCDADTARFYGRAKNRLRTRGRPIPENDLWIAALALQHEMALASPRIPADAGRLAFRRMPDERRQLWRRENCSGRVQPRSTFTESSPVQA